MTRLIALFAGQATGSAWLGTVASHRMAALLDPVTPADPSLADLSVVAVHVAAALAAVWLLLCTAHDTVRAARGGTVARSPKWIRRVINNAVGTALMVGLLAGPAAATDAPATDVPTDPVADVSPDFTEPEDGPPLASVTVPVPIVAPTPRPPAPAPTAASDPATTDGAATQTGRPTHDVAVGENLWVIARAHLLAASGDTPSDRDVHAYWVRLIAANLDGLRSGDPDLIFPGETLILPAADEVSP